jgi:methyltransferase family protein
VPYGVRSHWTRIAMYEAAKKHFEADAGKLDVVEISGGAFLDLLPWKSFRSVSGIDLCKDGWQFRAKDANLIVIDQVLEHVESPHEALVNIIKALPRGGRVFVSTPFLVKNHPSPEDHWRWTSSGLSLMLKRAGFKDVHSDSWGNRACAIANFALWETYRPADHSLVNEPDFPVTVWAWGTSPP